MGAGEVQKKYSRKGKLNKKKLCTPINPKKYSCYGLKKNSYKKFDNEKKFLRLENPPPPHHNFSNGPSLRVQATRTTWFRSPTRVTPVLEKRNKHVSGEIVSRRGGSSLVVPHFSSVIVERAKRERAWKAPQASPSRVSPFLRWGDFHARSRFARSTVLEDKRGTTRNLKNNRIDSQGDPLSSQFV